MGSSYGCFGASGNSFIQALDVVARSLRRNPIQVWRSDAWVPVAAQVAPTEVVRENDDDVRTPRGLWLRGIEAQNAKRGPKNEKGLKM